MNFDFNKISLINTKIYDYPTAYAILDKFADKFDVNEKVALFVVGPNGSGKSTLIANLYEQGVLTLPYVNADILARRLKTDDYYFVMQSAMDKVISFSEQGKSFVYETVFSDLNKLELANKIKEKGYKLYCIFVFTKSPQINIDRVAKRVKEGGHDVPVDKIILRYERSFKNIEPLRAISDKFLEFDNSKDMI